MTKAEKRDKKFGNLVVILVIILNILYTAGALYAFIRVGSEPTTLTISWFGFTTTELLALAKIKMDKIKSGQGNTQGGNIL